MKKEMYVTVVPETIVIDANTKERACTGRFFVNVFVVELNKLRKFFDIEVTEEEDVKEKLDDYLIDNGYGDEDIKFVFI